MHIYLTGLQTCRSSMVEPMQGIASGLAMGILKGYLSFLRIAMAHHHIIVTKISPLMYIHRMNPNVSKAVPEDSRASRQDVITVSALVYPQSGEKGR